MAGEAAENQLFYGFEVGALVCGGVEAREDAFAVLEDVEAEGDWGLRC